jgi:hypothetical protein
VHHLRDAILASVDSGDPNRHRGDLLRSADPRPVPLDLDGEGEVGALITVDTFSNPTTSPSR